MDFSFKPKKDSLAIGDGLIVEYSKEEQPKRQRLKAALLSIFLGHFGVHRIYLGTKANVPVFYSATLGGGLGLLPLIDFVAILSAKDLEKYKNTDRVVMWIKPRTTQP